MSRKLDELMAQLQECACESSGCDCAQQCRCDDVLDQLFALLDNEITEQDALRLIRHSANCPACLRRIEEEIVIRKVIRRGCCGESAPESLRMKITRITKYQVGR
ncbi:mycothiol system anti-sigma-R factor [Trueperella bialowiezensis]|uniref:Mycothiol system anti-sigma-R factor n=1 Tax=Trueperella bialowiezensis TaxID=312285 RepID=A0A3S4Z609_9ACTO|nr:mycothiol system anti-sigma-R factor [Trueperella bialowiezensis]VEI13739.1 mycothiol system anti-sigma-R factor [Trueperella bialowiezensis]